MRSARGLYRASALLAGLGALAVMLTAVMALHGLQIGWAPADRLARDCQRFLLPDPTPAAALKLVLLSLAATVMVLALRSALRQMRGTRRFVRSLPRVGDLELAGNRVTVVGGASEPVAFCAGFLRPRIYLSLTALEALSRAQLEAVIAHEAHHAQRRDPLRILHVRALAEGLFFLPTLRLLGRRYEQQAEIAADDAAVAARGDPAALAGALLHFGERGQPGLVVGIAPERVDHLLGEAPPRALPLLPIAGALLTLAGLLASTLVTVDARLNLLVMVARSCMVAMVLLPVAAVAGAAVLARRPAGARVR